MYIYIDLVDVDIWFGSCRFSEPQECYPCWALIQISLWKTLLEAWKVPCCKLIAIDVCIIQKTLGKMLEIIIDWFLLSGKVFHNQITTCLHLVIAHPLCSIRILGGYHTSNTIAVNAFDHLLWIHLYSANHNTHWTFSSCPHYTDWLYVSQKTKFK